VDGGHRLASYDTSLAEAAVLIVGEDDEMFMTRRLDVSQRQQNNAFNWTQ